MAVSTVDSLQENSGKPASFETAMKELQTIVTQLDAGQLSLSDSLACFERGTHLLKLCQQELDQAERKIEILTGFNAQGEPVTEPFEATSTLEQREQKAGRRKSTGKKSASAQDSPQNEDVEEPTREFPKEKSLFT